MGLVISCFCRELRVDLIYYAQFSLCMAYAYQHVALADNDKYQANMGRFTDTAAALGVFFATMSQVLHDQWTA